jgi:hypothetical protein
MRVQLIFQYSIKNKKADLFSGSALNFFEAYNLIGIHQIGLFKWFSSFS